MTNSDASLNMESLMEERRWPPGRSKKIWKDKVIININPFNSDDEKQRIERWLVEVRPQ